MLLHCNHYDGIVTCIYIYIIFLLPYANTRGTRLDVIKPAADLQYKDISNVI